MAVWNACIQKLIIMFDMKFSRNQIVYQKAKSIIRKILRHALTNFTICLSMFPFVPPGCLWEMEFGWKVFDLGPCVHDGYVLWDSLPLLTHYAMILPLDISSIFCNCSLAYSHCGAVPSGPLTACISVFRNFKQQNLNTKRSSPVILHFESNYNTLNNVWSCKQL